MYYVSFISEYPIFEPAEGGYYYAGETVVDCIACKTWKQAKKAYRKAIKEFKEVYEGRDLTEVNFGGVDKWGFGSFCKLNSCYIGQEDRVQITGYEPKNRGWVPYC